MMFIEEFQCSDLADLESDGFWNVVEPSVMWMHIDIFAQDEVFAFTALPRLDATAELVDLVADFGWQVEDAGGLLRIVLVVCHEVLLISKSWKVLKVEHVPLKCIMGLRLF